MKTTIKLLFTAAAISVLAACSNTDEEVSIPQAPQVEVANVMVESVTNWYDFTGTTTAPENVQLRPRVSGYIESVHFEEGSHVTQGDLLFTIDQDTFTAQVNQLKAQVSIANSQFTLAQKELERAQKLIKSNAISTEQLDQRAANVAQTKANVESATAALKFAELQLEYTDIRAPISGQVSNVFITEGNYVQAGTSVLTNLVSSNEMHVYFDANQATYLDFANAQINEKTMPVTISLAANTANEISLNAQIDFIDNKVNPQTGSISARAVLGNRNGMLVPGMFTRVRVYGANQKQTILIDEKAVGTDLNNKFVLVVNDNNQTEYRQVQLGKRIEGLRIVTSGLTATDKIVVNGLQRVRPGSEVNPVNVNMANDEVISQIRRLDAQIHSLRTALVAEQQANAQALSSVR